MDDHLDDILRTVHPLEPIELRLLDAHGCVLTEDVTVPGPLPPFANSAMDGYAVRTADVADATDTSPVALRVVGDIAAGSGTLPEIGPGQTARIMTGAPLPPGADAVAPVEWTDGGSGGGPAQAMATGAGATAGTAGRVRVFRPVTARRHVREAGSDLTAGEVAVPAGTPLGAPQVGLLAAIGRATVRVRPRPRVVVVSTGSELAQPGQELAAGQIYDANSFTLAAAAREAGAEVYRVVAVADDAAEFRTTLEDQLSRADLIVTSGGVSVGAYDVVKEALTEHAIDEVAGGVEFRRLAMQPGKPQGFGVVGTAGVPLLALPGNPVSSYVSFELFVRPALRALAGRRELHRPGVRARLATEAPLSSPVGRRQYLRAVHDPESGTVRPVGGAGSHLAGALSRADALLVVPERTTTVEPGAEVDVLLLGPSPG